MPPEENNYKVGIDPVFVGKKTENNNISASAFNVLNNQKYTPSTSPTETTKPNTGDSGPKSIVRTYKGDLASAIETNHLSSVNIALAENEKMRSQVTADKSDFSQANNYSKGKTIIFISLILIIGGVIGLAAVYMSKSQTPAEVVRPQEIPFLITTEYKDGLDTDLIAKDRLAEILSIKINDARIPAGNFYNVYLTTGTSTARRLVKAGEFVSLMNLEMPNMTKRTLLPDFMVGIYSFDSNRPFVIFKTSSFENTYAGMLQWEKDLENDFKIPFRLPGYEGQTGILSDLSPVTAKKFEDGVILNKDVRILRDESKNTILLYSIIDRETIVITVSEAAFKGILDRLNKEKTLKR